MENLFGCLSLKGLLLVFKFLCISMCPKKCKNDTFLGWKREDIQKLIVPMLFILLLAENLDILITHMPPLGVLDDNTGMYSTISM